MAAQVDDRLRDRLDELFRELCAIASPSGSEHAVRERVAELSRAAGFGDQRTDPKGNLWARRTPAPHARGRTVLCAHMDTVGHDLPIVPVLVDDGWENENDAILGADNKAAVAVMLACIERLDEQGDPGLDGVELLFTVEEEEALAGAAAIDPAGLEGAVVYVFDHATPIGELIVASPTYYRLDASFRGQAAHAGICPERGRPAIRAAARAVSAMPHGRLDDETTANAGQIHGGTGTTTNIVADRCDVAIEARSLDRAKVEALVAEICDCLHDAAAAEECDLELRVEQRFTGYRHDPGSPAVTRAVRALERAGHPPRLVASGGASDANAFLALGIESVCLANGTEAAHEPTERVSRTALAEMARVTFFLLAGD
ncbi:MAG: M20/M25/M40 family metallo-hydrolase [Baekduia sp.]